MKPKNWDDDAPLYNKVGTTKGKEEPKPIEPSFIPMVFVSKSLSAYKTKNPLYQYLCGVIGVSAKMRLSVSSVCILSEQGTNGEDVLSSGRLTPMVM